MTYSPRPQLAKFSHTDCCIVEALHDLDKMQVPIALHLVDAKRQPNSDWGQFSVYFYNVTSLRTFRPLHDQERNPVSLL